MRVAVVGAGGMLGRDLCPILAERHEVTPLTRAEADATDLAALRAAFAALRPEAVVNCAAATDVDRCEQDPDYAYRGNTWAAWAVAAAAEEAGARLIHVSTDFVFDGEAGRPYSEWDAPNPISVYGASKLAGEQAAFRACRRATVARTQWLYGPHGKSFPRAILNAAAREGTTELRVVADQFGAPTFTGHLARKLAWLVEWPAHGLYHVNNAGECSRAEWAREVLRLAGSPVRVVEIGSAEWPAPACRPRRSTLRRHALELQGADDLPDWRSGLAAWFSSP